MRHLRSRATGILRSSPIVCRLESRVTTRTIACLAVLFDCDGVLVDSDASVMQAWGDWAVHHGLDPVTVGEMVHGRRAADTVALLIDEAGRPGAVDLINRLEIEGAVVVTAIPGAPELTRSIPTGQWAVVTSGTRPLATARIAAAGLPLPGVLVTADDVRNGKPDPEGFVAAATALGHDPRDTVVLEDSPAGVKAARAAGVGAVIGIGERALATDADVVVADLSALSWTGQGLLAIDPLRSV